MTKPHSHSQDSSPPSTDLSASDGLAGTAAKRGRPSLEEAQRLPARILEAGWEVLRDHGFEAFTFDRVARHAHIGKATIYSRFAGKREFLEALLAHKTVERRLEIMKLGAGLPLMDSFCMRAAAVMHVLHSPEGRMMERLVDWCDQEFGNGEMNYRQAMYIDALTNITDELREIAHEQNLALAEPELAARFWLEGLLGHARLEGPVGEIDAAANERWARAYSEFFFASLRHSGNITAPSAQP
ncbi:TetR/AcrR family transcriptional regulator [Novosphingobium jiangmenense]|uniref:TetR/AcrR family transcriptional regulator n=1 Tax=Novosphingobium jiangmenense TaxID=2791981 RepID=A0ABS0HH49_9SPHN|nr:TetR/AcrR family transcriptional regulator [Novosphingobium jiangmenense]MBF9151483.1 TetR/AcrR family transcriptional regulator [Novosphingobium jiangmenense]